MNLITKRLTMVFILLGLMINPLCAMSNDGKLRSIEVFTITGMPPQNMPSNAVLVEIDAAGRIDALLSESLPDDPEQAVAFMQQVMGSPEWEVFSQQLKQAYTGLARAQQLNIEKVPAIVINSTFVIYGVTKVDDALKLFHEYHHEGR